MQTFYIIRVSCRSVFYISFSCAIIIGGAGGIFLGLMEPAIGLLGGAFIGCVLAILASSVCLLSAVIFNILSPLYGGLKLHIQEQQQTDKETMELLPDQEEPTESA